jgi:branched-subunit amino acid transport protein
VTTMILLVAAVTYLIKTLPFFVKINPSANSLWAKGADYSVCVMMGQIIMDSAIGGKPLAALLEVDIFDIGALAAALASFIVCRMSESIFKSLIAGLATFTLISGGLL